MDRRTRDNQQPISAGRFHRQGAGHDHTNPYSDREPKCDTNGNCYTHCYRNRDGYTHRYCDCYGHCYGYSYRDSYSYGNRYTHCYCYSYTHCYCYSYAHCNCYSYAHCNGNRYSNANVDTDANTNTNSHSNRDAETYAHAAVSPYTKASSNSTATVGFPAAGGSPRGGPRAQDRRLRLVCPVSLGRSRREGHNRKSVAMPRHDVSYRTDPNHYRIPESHCHWTFVT